jgi:Bacterial regulatory proteins, tetR family
MRAIAAAAGVDQKLVAHFFGSKQRLFVEVFTPPFDPAVAIPGTLTGEGERDRRARGALPPRPARGPRWPPTDHRVDPGCCV